VGKKLAINLYNCSNNWKGFSLKEICDYLQEKLPQAEINQCQDFFKEFACLPADISNAAYEWATSRVKDPFSQKLNRQPLPMEVEYERRRLKGEIKTFGIMYDGNLIVRLMWGFLPSSYRQSQRINIVFTDQIIGTKDGQKGSYHARTILLACPVIISIPGLVVAPAKPVEYYLEKSLSTTAGLPKRVPTNSGNSYSLGFNDHRLTEVVKGYVMQAIFYYCFGEPFCDDEDCRLYNSHWQAQMLKSQLGGAYEFCPKHQKKLENLGREIDQEPKRQQVIPSCQS
jgi:hypothetical protein